MDNRTEVTYSGRLMIAAAHSTTDGDDDAISNAFAKVMDHLVGINVVDPSVSGSATTGHFQISVVVQATDRNDAFAKADPIVRGALHAADIYTSSWDDERDLRFITATFYRYELEVDNDDHLIGA